MAKRPEGTCHICGRYGPLSFEHIPPRSAYNDRPVISITFEEAMSLGPDEHAHTTARTVAIHQGETVNRRALTAMFQQIIANNRASGWRKVKRER